MFLDVLLFRMMYYALLHKFFSSRLYLLTFKPNRKMKKLQRIQICNGLANKDVINEKFLHLWNVQSFNQEDLNVVLSLYEILYMLYILSFKCWNGSSASGALIYISDGRHLHNCALLDSDLKGHDTTWQNMTLCKRYRCEINSSIPKRSGHC